MPRTAGVNLEILEADRGIEISGSNRIWRRQYPLRHPTRTLATVGEERYGAVTDIMDLASMYHLWIRSWRTSTSMSNT